MIINYCYMGTYLLFKAPPTSQSQGLQPSISLLRPQCCGWKGKLCYTHTQTRKYTNQITQTYNNTLLPDTGYSLVRSQDVCSSNFLSVYHRGFLLGMYLEDYSCMLGRPKHTQWKRKMNMIILTDNRQTGSQRSKPWKNMNKAAGENMCVFTHADSLMGRHWGHSVPFCSGHNVVPPH